MDCPFRGSYVALPTPFDGDGIDYESLGRLIDFHVEHGTDGLVVAGTSGEAATLTDAERRTVIEAVVGGSAGRLPVIAGTGTNATAASVEFTRFAAEAGAQGILAVTPYYNRPSPNGLVAHYGAIAEASDLPVVLYNVPGRTGCDMKPATVARVREQYPSVVAIKEATGSVGRAQAIRESSDIALIVGEDALIGELMGLGAVGVIGVVANVAPAQVAELCRAAAPGGDPARAAELSAFLDALIHAMFIETNPVPMKTALAEMGLCSAEVRLPLAPLLPENLESLRSALHEARLAAPAGARSGV